MYFLLFRNRMLNFETLSYLCMLTEDVNPIYVTGLELHYNLNFVSLADGWAIYSVTSRLCKIQGKSDLAPSFNISSFLYDALFLKGYKLNMSKISQTFNIQPPDFPQDWVDWVISIINCIPRDAYEYIGNGYENDGKLNVMIVMAAGRDEKELMKTPVTPSDKTLADVAHRVCTPAIWPSFDGAFCLLNSNFSWESLLKRRRTDIDSPPTFWDGWRSGATSLLEWNGAVQKDSDAGPALLLQTPRQRAA